jgi:hypothetical protein
MKCLIVLSFILFFNFYLENIVSGSFINPGNENNGTQKNVIEKFRDWFGRLNNWKQFCFIFFCYLVCSTCIWLAIFAIFEFSFPRGKHKKNNGTEKVESYKQQEFFVNTTVTVLNNKKESEIIENMNHKQVKTTFEST